MNKDTLLCEELNNRNLNLHTLSEKSGIAYSTIYNLFTGKRKVSDAKAENLYRIARVLGLSMDVLFSKLALNEDEDKVLPDFLLMWKDEVVASVKIHDTSVAIERFDLNPIKQIFYKDNISRFEFGEILRRRCWDEHRADIKILLNAIGLNEFNPYKICRKTHGLMVQDKTWFKFEGETISYKEVLRRNHDS
jgi:transcriptional regulator with XRE-family HTH domain